MKEIKSLITGCVISALVFIISLGSFINYLEIPLDHLPIPYPLMNYGQGVESQHSANVSESTSIQDQLNSIRGDVVSMQDQIDELKEKMESKKKSSPSTFVAVSILMLMWISGIFFSTFTRELAEKTRDRVSSIRGE